MSEPDNGEICQHCGMTFGDHAFGGRWCMPLSKGTRFVSGEDCQLIRLTAENAALRERIKELERTLDTVITDVNYEGGVQHWIAKYRESSMLALDLATKVAELEKFASECANDSLDRVSPGIKQAARQALTPAKEGV